MEKLEVIQLTKSPRRHDIAKAAAISCLLDMGFSLKQIRTECRVFAPLNRRSFIVDVVGQSKNRKVAFECGRTEKSKLAFLCMLFDEVHHLPYKGQKSVQISIDQLKNFTQSYIADFQDTIGEIMSRLNKLEAKNFA